MPPEPPGVPPIQDRLPDWFKAEVEEKRRRTAGESRRRSGRMWLSAMLVTLVGAGLAAAIALLLGNIGPFYWFHVALGGVTACLLAVFEWGVFGGMFLYGGSAVALQLGLWMQNPSAAGFKHFHAWIFFVTAGGLLGIWAALGRSHTE